MKRRVFSVVAVAAALALCFDAASAQSAFTRDRGQQEPRAADDGVLDLDGAHRALLVRIARHDLQEWLQEPVVLAALRTQNSFSESVTPAMIDQLEAGWNMGVRSLLVEDVLARPASVEMRRRRDASDGLVTEIILMDSKGLNAAISGRTSDVWQGDEAKYLETFPKGPGAFHVGDLERDESTGKLQTQISLTVTDPETGAPIGAITIGIDVERARQLEDAGRLESAAGL